MDRFDRVSESQEHSGDEKKDIVEYHPADGFENVDTAGDEADVVLDNSLADLNDLERVLGKGPESLTLGELILNKEELITLTKYGINKIDLEKAELGDTEAKKNVVKNATLGIKGHAYVASGPAVTNYFYDPSLDLSVRDSEKDNSMLRDLKERYTTV